MAVPESQIALRLLVVSDLLATNQPDEPVSWMVPPYEGNLENPFFAMQQTLGDVRLDLVVCAGNLISSEDSSALHEIWARLATFAEEHDAKLVCAPGDHDTFSGGDGIRTFEHLRTLQPTYPIPSHDSPDAYWRDSLAVLEDQSGEISYRILTLLNGAKNPNLEPQLAGDSTISALERYLEASEQCSIQILLLHEPLEDPPNPLWTSPTAIPRAGRILQLLESTGQWLIIHGNHQPPDAFYAHGGSGAPAIFCPASFASRSGTVLTGLPNQFYLIEIPVPGSATQHQPLSMPIIFRSWDWKYPFGWQTASTNLGLPSVGGMGWRTDLVALAEAIRQHVVEKAASKLGPTLTFSELRARIPLLPFLIPRDLTAVIRHLSTGSPAVFTSHDSNGQILHMGVRALPTIAETAWPLRSDDRGLRWN